MKSIAYMQKLLWLLLFIPFVFYSCEDKMEDYYEMPDWMKGRGSAWELLENEKEYSIFLEGLTLAGFRPYLEGKGIVTVMAPNDEAFTKYLNENNYASIKDVDVQELKKILGFHLLYYSYTKSMLEDFRPEGQGAGDGDAEILDPGMYYKFRTRSSSPVTKELDPVNKKNVTVYHLERLIPVFSHNFFNTKKIDAKKNYEFFYPNSTWMGNNGFNVSEATVTNYELVTNNGYVYTIDRVLQPMETIYDELRKNPKYSTFLELYNSYSFYEYDANISIDYGTNLGVDSLFLHKHRDPLPPIALEWPTSDYRRLDTLAYKSYSVFAPTNNALNTLFSEYWQNNGYTSIKELDPLIMRIFLSEYVYGGSVVFPDEIISGVIKSTYGSVYNFDPYSATDKKMCVNGSFYGLDNATGPNLFTSVIGSSFQSKKYLHFLYAMNNSGTLNSFGSEQKYTMLIPNKDAFETNGYFLVENEAGTFLAEKNGEEWVTVGADILKNIVNAHTAIGEVKFNPSGTQVLPNVIPYNYWYVKDGKITSSNSFNRILDPAGFDPFVSFQEITNNGKPWNNGKAYTYDSSQGLFESIFESDPLKKVLATNNDHRYPYYAFAQLLRKAGLISGNDILGVSGRFIAFIPNNEAIYLALANNEIPGIMNGTLDTNGNWTGTFDTELLKEYMYDYFVAASQIPTCPYPGSEMESGEYFTYSGNYLIYTENSSLSVQLKDGIRVCQVVADYDYFPFAYSDGSFHIINSILE